MFWKFLFYWSCYILDFVCDIIFLFCLDYASYYIVKEVYIIRENRITQKKEVEHETYIMGALH